MLSLKKRVAPTVLAASALVGGFGAVGTVAVASAPSAFACGDGTAAGDRACGGPITNYEVHSAARYSSKSSCITNENGAIHTILSKNTRAWSRFIISKGSCSYNGHYWSYGSIHYSTGVLGKAFNTDWNYNG